MKKQIFFSRVIVTLLFFTSLMAAQKRDDFIISGEYTLSSPVKNTGSVVVKAGNLCINGLGILIPKGLFVTDNGHLTHQTSHNYGEGAFIYITEYGYVDFSSTSQELSRILVRKGSLLGSNATVTLSSRCPLVMEGVSVIAVKNLIFKYGGLFSLSSAQGLVNGSLCKGHFMTIDLNGQQMILDLPHETTPYETGFCNVVIQNGSVVKRGPGTLFFTGQLSAISVLSLLEGKILIGQKSSDVVSSGTITIESQGSLGGLGTLTGDVMNSGTVMDSFTIEGNYTQSPLGSFSCKVSSSGNDKMTVNGQVKLEGTLHLESLSECPRKRMIILKSSLPISGKFTKLVSDRDAKIFYLDNRVEVQLN